MGTKLLIRMKMPENNPRLRFANGFGQFGFGGFFDLLYRTEFPQQLLRTLVADAFDVGKL